MAVFLTALIPVLLALVGVALAIAGLIGRFARKPEDSKVRQAIDRNLVRGNLPADPSAQLAAGVALILLAAGLAAALLSGDAWRGW